MTPEKPTAAELIEMVQAHRKALIDEHEQLCERVREIDSELEILDAVKPPPKPRAPRSDKGTTRKKPNGEVRPPTVKEMDAHFSRDRLDAQGDPVLEFGARIK